jgi:hypothetical protein
MTRFALTRVTVDDTDTLTFYDTRLFMDATAAVKAAHEWTCQEDELTPSRLKEHVDVLQRVNQEPFTTQLMEGLNRLSLLDRVEVF